MNSGIQKGMMKYCVVGNIVAEHCDETGEIRYGTAVYPGGRKVYISRRFWGDEVTVIGLNRFKSKYAMERVPLALIENIRFSKTFKTRVLELMENNSESTDMWWGYKEADRVGAEQYAQLLNRVKAGDTQARDQYINEVMAPFI
ncbi:MAG: hypothetical protein IK080_01900 [Clostridia bacterium]|nr:hypothetical protein [Clostridia bacterium]